MWNEIIELGNMQEDIVKGEPIQTLVYKELYANKKSIRQSEYYQAAVTGLKPELVFEVHTFEYNNEQKLRYPAGEAGKVYDIIRTYENGEKMELTVSSFLEGG